VELKSPGNLPGLFLLAVDNRPGLAADAGSQPRVSAT
jgi:hypothetical protein